MRLVLVRHAKSARPPDTADHDRPLAPRGIEDATAVGAFLAKRGAIPGRIVTSAAVRAVETSRILADFADPQHPVRVDESLYGGGVATVLAAASGVDDVMIVGHEPTMSMAVELLTGATAAMVTTAVACIEITGQPDDAPWVGTLIWLVTPGLVRGTRP